MQHKWLQPPEWFTLPDKHGWIYDILQSWSGSYMSNFSFSIRLLHNQH